MAEETTTPGKRENFVWVKDRSGNEFMCPAGSLKDPKSASDEELENCVDDAKVAIKSPGG